LALEVMLVQFLVLAFTAVVWWLARRDLSARAASLHAPAVADLENLQAVIEALTADLEFRAEAAEQRIRDAEQRLAMIVARERPLAPSSGGIGEEPEGAAREEGAASSARTSGSPELGRAGNVAGLPEDERYAPVHALLAEGITDAGEIARRTGLGQGEVLLLLGLRERQL